MLAIKNHDIMCFFVTNCNTGDVRTTLYYIEIDYEYILNNDFLFWTTMAK